MRLPASFYHATADTGPRFEPLSGPSDARVAIVGGGFAGLATAMSLVERGVRDIVLQGSPNEEGTASPSPGSFCCGRPPYSPSTLSALV